jgi:hypothetical protein
VTIGEEQSSTASESEGDSAIEQGMNEELTSPTIYEEVQIIISDDSSQSLGRYDRIADDGDQVFAANYVTDGEGAQGQSDLGDFVFFKEITTPSSVSSIVTTIKNWILEKLN